jgi:hypothetical protein
MGSNTKQLSRSALATAIQTLVCRHHFNREVARATNNHARNSAAIRAEHLDLKKLQALGLTGLNRAMVAARRESLNAVAAKLGITMW